MMSATHMPFGAACWLGFCAVFPQPAPAVLGGAAIAYYTACWPDIDTPRSLAARSFPPVTPALSWVIRRTGGGHRGVTHHAVTVAVLAALAVFPVLWWPRVWWIPVAAVAGYMSHPVLDTVTTFLGIRSGKRKRRKGIMRYGAEYWAVRPLVYLAGAGAFALIVLHQAVTG